MMTRHTTWLAGLAALALAAPTAGAQDALKEKRAAKIAKPVFDKADWLFDFDDAQARAAEQGKFVLTYFTRSYSP